MQQSKIEQTFRRNLIWLSAAIVLFGLSSLRHFLIRSGAWDLGIFDQAVYLISQNQTPFSTLLGFHILGDHAAFIFYPLALLYRMIPSVYCLLFVQSIALSLGVIPLRLLAHQLNVSSKLINVLTIVYLLYPIVFNSNMSDFHPEVLTIPIFLTAVWAVRSNRNVIFYLSLFIILICRDALALNVIGMGVWLWIFEKKRRYGAIAIVAGALWFWIATQMIVPAFGADAAQLDRYLPRYATFGHSYTEIAKNFILRPDLLIRKLATGETIGYLLAILAPIVWWIRPRQIAPILGALPTIAMNLLSDNPGQRSLTNQYSVPVLPFLMLIALGVAASSKKLPAPRFLISWAVIGFLTLGKYGLFGVYLQYIDWGTWSATQAAIRQIPPQASVLAEFTIVPHLSHRPQINTIERSTSELNYAAQADYVLLKRRNVWVGNAARMQPWFEYFQSSPQFKLQFSDQEVYLYRKR